MVAHAFFWARVRAKGSDFTSRLVSVCLSGIRGADLPRRSR